MGTTLSVSPLLGKNVSIYGGRLNSDGTFPDTPFTITIDNTVDVAVADSSITVTALSGEVREGTFLTFVEPTSGALKTVYVTADAAAGATSISIGDGNSTSFNGVADAGSPVGIEDGATASYPPEVLSATDSSVDTSPQTISAQTYNSNGFEVKAVVGESSSISIPVQFKTETNGGARTLERAAREKNPVGLIKVYPTPSGYSAGEKLILDGFVSYSDSSPAADVIGAEFTFEVNGAPTKIEPVA